MNINIAKLLCLVILQKAESKSLSLMWVRCLYNMMQMNKTMLNFIKKKNYGNLHLDDLSEWVSVNYFDSFKGENIKYCRIPKDEEIPVEMTTWRSLRVKNPATGRDLWVHLNHMPNFSPSLCSRGNKEYMKIDVMKLVKGKVDFQFRINKNTILELPKKNVAHEDREKEIINNLLFLGCKNDVTTIRTIAPQVQRILKGTKYQNPSLLDPNLIPPLSITLKEYQKENIRWMLNVEHDAPLSIPYIPSIPISNGTLWINPVTNIIYSSKPKKQVLELYGGVILDTVGMGKTIVAIVSSLMNPADALLRTPRGTVKQVEQRPCSAVIESKGSKRKGEICGKKSLDNKIGLCKTHLKKIQTNMDEVQINTEIDTYDISVDKCSWFQNIFNNTCKRFRSRATLIIVTNTLPNRWMTEMNLLKNRWDYNILPVISKHDYETTSYEDVINADFIITTFDFITFNGSFQRDMDMQIIMNKISNKTLPSDITVKQIIERKKPFFLNFYWNRIIVDEIHTVETEKFRNSQLKHLLCKMRANYKWCLSGSAFINNLGSYTFILDFLYTARHDEYIVKSDDTTDTDNLQIKPLPTAQELRQQQLFRHLANNPAAQQALQQHPGLMGQQVSVQTSDEYSLVSNLRKSYVFLKPYHHKNIFDNCFRCNSYESAQSEISFDLPITFKNYHVNLTTAEKGMYHNRMARYNARDLVNDECLRQICCHPKLNAQIDKSLTGIDNLGEMYNNVYYNLLKDIHESSTKIAELQTNVTYFISEKARHLGSKSKSGYEWAKQALKKQKAALTKETNDRTKLIEAAKVFERPGVEVKYDNEDWIKKEIGYLYQLPALNKIKLKYTNGVIDESIDFDVDATMIDKYGSKLSYLISFLKKEMNNSPDSKFIIFSQWESFIALIADTLKEHSIPAFCCKGNVYQKRKAVNLFKDKVVTSTTENEINTVENKSKKQSKKNTENTENTENTTKKKRVKKVKENCRIILLSLKSADSGLDLPEADTIIFMDWIKGDNTYKKCIKTQAIGRARRMGQQKRIKVIHFVAKDTIEEDMIVEKEDSEDSDVGEVMEPIFQKIGTTYTNEKNESDDEYESIDGFVMDTEHENQFGDEYESSDQYNSNDSKNDEGDVTTGTKII
jgi:SNF2 family DNA or RNA helicase